MRKSKVWRKSAKASVSLILGVFLLLSVLPVGAFAEQLPESVIEEVAELEPSDEGGVLPETETETETEIAEEPESDGDPELIVIRPADTASALQATINNYASGTGSLSAALGVNTVTVTGTVTGATAGLTLNIDAGVTVYWQASLSGSINPSGSISGYMLTLTGTGTFNLNTGGVIENNGTGGAISVSGSTLSVNGGTVNSPGSGIAIFNDGAAGSAISINTGSTVTAGNSSAIQANSAGTVVTITGGTVTNAAISNINPTINMAFIPTAAQANITNVVISGGLVQTTNPSSTSYVIQTAQNVTISGSAQVTALAGRAINLIGINSIATVNGSAVVSAVSGIAISTATTNVNTVPNAQIIVNGGTVSTQTGTAAIQTTGTNGKVTVTGGQVTATSGVAIKATNNVAISGGFVFAYGTVIGQVVSAPNTNFPTGGGVVTAWNNATLNPLYVEGTAGDLVILPANPASPPNSVYWHNSGAVNGIQYSNGSTAGFFQLPVTVTTLTSGIQGLIFDINSGMFYIGTVSLGSEYTDQNSNWTWDSGTLTLDGFSWSTTAPVALTIVGGSSINIELDGANTFASTGSGTGAAGISSGASITVVQASAGTLNASAAAGIGIDCGANNLTMQGGTVNAAAGNGTNAHGLNVGTLTIAGGTLNASSGGPATTGAYYGINAARLVVTDGDGVVTASGNSRAINNAALNLPAGYQYSKGTKPDGSNASTFIVPGAAAYVYSANNCYVQIKALVPYDLTVDSGGLGNGIIVGSFYPGQTVTVTAAIVPSTSSTYNLGLGPITSTQGNPGTYPLSINVFKDWISSGGGVFADATSQSTTFTMPGNDVTVTAEAQTAYRLWMSGARIDNPQNLNWQLGYYLPGTQVLLVSTASSYGVTYKFDGWTDSIAPNGTPIIGPGVFTDSNSYLTTGYIMPASDAYVQAPWSLIPATFTTLYTLTVTGGTGATTLIPAAGIVPGIMAGTRVNLVAATPAPGYEFDCWTITPTTAVAPPSYPGAFFDIKNPSTQFIMGEGNITVAASYKVIKYMLIVVNGTDEMAVGQYAPGEIVKVKAGPPPAMSEFTYWSVETGMILDSITGGFVDREVQEATFIMPPGHTTVTANYAKVYFELTVVDGLGSGEYKNGDLVVINASAPPGLVFVRWAVISGGAKISSAGNTDAVVTMPGRDATVRAIFRTAGPQLTGGPTHGQSYSDSAATGDGSTMPAWWLALVASLIGILFTGRRWIRI